MHRRALAAVVILAGLAALLVWRTNPSRPAARPGERPQSGVAAPGPGATPPSSPPLAAKAEADGAAEAVPAAQTEPEFPPIEGVVVTADGKPVAGAAVLMWGGGDSPVVTDGNGRFTLPGSEHGVVRVRASAKGLVADNPSVRATVGTENRLVLVPGRPVRVLVTRAKDGSPIEGARVRSVDGDNGFWGESFEQAHFTDEVRTGAGGTATVLAREGACRLHVSARGYASVATPPTYVAPQGASVEAVLGGAGTILGKVLAPDHNPVAGARVHALFRVVHDVHVLTGPDGSFRIDDVPPLGTPSEHFRTPPQVVVSVRAPGWAPGVVEIDPPPEGGERSIEVRLVTGRVLEGVVRSSDGDPVAGAEVTGQPDATLWWEEAPHRATSDAEGRFRFEQVAPGETFFIARRREISFQASRTLVVPVEGGPPVELVEDRRRGVGSVHVRVLDAIGAPVADAWVDAEYPQADGTSVFLDRESVDVGGRAVIRGLPDEALHLEVGSPRFVTRTVAIDLSKPLLSEVLIVMPEGEVEGRILLADETPARVEFAIVGMTAPPEELDALFLAHGTTDAHGRFRFEGLGAGTYGIHLLTKGLLLATGPRTFRAGATPTWTVVPAQDGDVPPVAVQLVDDGTGAPLEGATVALQLGGWADASAVEGRAGMYACEGPVEPGRYRVRVRPRGALEVVVPGVLLGKDGPPPRVPVPIDLGAVLEGRVIAPDGRGIGGLNIEVGNQWVDVAEDGTFRITGLPDGHAKLAVSGAFLRQETLVRVEVSRTRTTRHDIRAEPAGEVVVSAPRATPPQREVVVRLRRADGVEEVDQALASRWVIWPEVDGEVAFSSFWGLAPGRYEVRVSWDDVERPVVPVDVKVLESVKVRVTPP